MDRAMKFLAVVIPMMIVIGTILEYFEVEKANVVTGLGVLSVMFVLIPFFLFWRYDKKQQRKVKESKQEK
ncbi:MAG: hypothetical protein KAH10_08370 [Flavobacteriales bacterium]|nr:hypothetical protein [Flavobacteriales bacterium]